MEKAGLSGYNGSGMLSAQRQGYEAAEEVTFAPTTGRELVKNEGSQALGVKDTLQVMLHRGTLRIFEEGARVASKPSSTFLIPYLRQQVIIYYTLSWVYSMIAV